MSSKTVNATPIPNLTTRLFSLAKESIEPANAEPGVCQEKTDLASKITSWAWDGLDVEDVRRRLFDIETHAPEKFAVIKMSVPARARESVDYVLYENPANSSEQVRQTFEIIAADLFGNAIVRTGYCRASLNDKAHLFSVMSLSAAEQSLRFLIDEFVDNERVNQSSAPALNDGAFA